MNLSQKTCLITGANTGLGFAMAKHFAAQGAETILLCLLFASLEFSKRPEGKGISTAMIDPG